MENRKNGSSIIIQTKSEITTMDVYAIVTERIISLLETGVVPWRKPWTSTGLPRNLITKKPYRGINYFLLSASKFVSPFWLTMRQANHLGGCIRQGEESTIVVFWKVEDSKETSDDIDPEENHDKKHRRFLLRYYRAFNFEQCELPQVVLDKLPKVETRKHEPIVACAEIMGCMPNAPEIVHAGSKAFYSPITDRVTLPTPELFSSAEEYYATGLHELIHYAEFRIMPRSLTRTSKAVCSGTACRHNPEGIGAGRLLDLVAQHTAALSVVPTAMGYERDARRTSSS